MTQDAGWSTGLGHFSSFFLFLARLPGYPFAHGHGRLW